MITNRSTHSPLQQQMLRRSHWLSLPGSRQCILWLLCSLPLWLALCGCFSRRRWQKCASLGFKKIKQITMWKKNLVFTWLLTIQHADHDQCKHCGHWDIWTIRTQKFFVEQRWYNGRRLGGRSAVNELSSKNQCGSMVSHITHCLCSSFCQPNFL